MENWGKSWKNGRQQKIQAIFEISGGIFFHGLEYLIRYDILMALYCKSGQLFYSDLHITQMSQYACYDRNLFNIHFRNSWFTFGNLCTWNQHFCIKCPCMYIIALGPYSLLFVFYTATVTNWGMCVSGANITQQWTNTIPWRYNMV